MNFRKGIVWLAVTVVLASTGLYLQGTESASLKGIFPAVALEEKQAHDRDVRVVKRADYIARTRGRRTFPWRVVIIAEKDGDLIESQMVYKLAKPLQLEDTSWIKPGKVAWDWWNANNIYGVDYARPMRLLRPLTRTIRPHRS